MKYNGFADLKSGDGAASLLVSGPVALSSYAYSATSSSDTESGSDGELSPTAKHHYTRYCDQAMDWRTRLFGLVGSMVIVLLVLGCALITWQVVHPPIAPTLSVFDVAPPAAPPEPVQEVPEGPQQAERKEQKPREEERPEPPKVIMPNFSETLPLAPPPVEQIKAADPVPETTAPKSVPAPLAHRVANDAKATWEGLLMAHLEKHRRYPASARARREQGTVYVCFRMNRAGAVLSVSLARSSGSAILDHAAIDTISRSQPLPAIPDDRPDELELSIPVEFFVR